MRIIAALLAIAALAACSQQPADDVRAPLEDETRIVGEVTQVEDGGYPQYTVHVTPEGGEPMQLYLNAEGEADLGGVEPGAFAGQTATIYFTTTPRLDLFDLRQGGQSVIGSQSEPQGESVTGVLSGVSEPSGDLPSEITVTDADGRASVFEYYVTTDMAALEGQEVTAYYTPGERQEVSLMRTHAAQ